MKSGKKNTLQTQLGQLKSRQGGKGLQCPGDYQRLVIEQNSIECAKHFNKD